MKHLRALWSKVNEPRVIAASHALVYFALFSAGLYALVNPPSTVDYAIGQPAMYLLAGILAAGGAIGVPTALWGTWWLERTAVGLVALALSLYLIVVLWMQYDSTSGNRLLQAAAIFGLIVLHFPVRWHRVKQRPWDPDRPRVTDSN
ncbi:MAG TPA: hypothetical protein VK095_06460 [Beutenbergiaceae bacterium]|nr:hypothetical protein [Beutenbergiaceae bacterium]